MDKFLIRSEEEYRKHAFERCSKKSQLDRYYGLAMIRECYEYDDDGNSLDEEGNIIPDDTPEGVEVDDFVKAFTYPLMILEWIELDAFDRVGNASVICIQFIELKEFETGIEEDERRGFVVRHYL